MNIKADKAIYDKIMFIFHRIILGVVYWILASFFIAYQQFVIGKYGMGHILTGLLFYLIPFMLFLWFSRICVVKNQWKPFMKHSDIIGLIFICIGFLIPFLSFINVNVVHFLP